jgi:recombinational DNA repair ATPase RecF
MPLRLLQLKEFSAFNAAEFDLVDGLNVFVGGNGTGKTHVLKLIYTILKSVSVIQRCSRSLPTCSSRMMTRSVALSDSSTD